MCARQALLVQLVQQPQDGSADTAVRLALAPSYVTYLPAAVERVLDFFRTEQVRELEQLRGNVALTHPLQYLPAVVECVLFECGPRR